MDCYKGVTGTIYEYGALTLNGEEYIPFKQYAGKHVLFVNVATYWGLTAQYPGKNYVSTLWELALSDGQILNPEGFANLLLGGSRGMRG